MTEPSLPANGRPKRAGPLTEKLLANSLRTRRGVAWVMAAVVVLSFLLYLPTIRYDFVWDDTSLITNNRLLAGSAAWQLLGQAFWQGAPETPDGPALLYYRPLTTFSFWADLKLAGPNPWYFHLVNIILNALAAGVVALIIWELLHSGVWAGLGGLLFAANPAHVESAAFISGRTDILLTLFIGIAAFALVRSLRKRDIRWWALVPPCFFLGLLCKETAILFPVLVALAPLLTQTSYDRRYWVLAAATLLVASGYLLLRAVVLGQHSGLPLNGFVETVNTLGLYVRAFFWPVAHKVKIPADPGFAILTPNAIAALLFIVTIPLAAVRRRFWVSLLGYTWALLFLLPVTVLDIGPQAAERLLYLPSAGLVIVVITILSRLLHTRLLLRRIAGTGLVLVIIACGWDTLRRSRVWRDEATLFSTMTREAPRAPSGYANLAHAIRLTHPDSAIRLYNRALAMDQGYVRVHVDLGVLLGRQADFRQAIHHLRLADELRPNSAQILNNLGLAFLAWGKHDSAVAYLGRAAAIEPNSAPTRLNYALALNALGSQAAADSDAKRASLAQLHLAVKLDPDLIPARLALSEEYERRGRLDSALIHLEHAVRLDSGMPASLNRLGTLLIRTGDSARAQTSYLRALALDSTLVPALYNQAILYSVRGDSASARLLAERAYRLRPDLASIRDLYLALSRPK